MLADAVAIIGTMVCQILCYPHPFLTHHVHLFRIWSSGAFLFLVFSLHGLCFLPLMVSEVDR